MLQQGINRALTKEARRLGEYEELPVNHAARRLVTWQTVRDLEAIRDTLQANGKSAYDYQGMIDADRGGMGWTVDPEGPEDVSGDSRRAQFRRDLSRDAYLLPRRPSGAPLGPPAHRLR